ncbi:MAG: glycoside hydrolase family 32 protein [Lachnospiraceae bacterium]|nr:glycoside hydrolase family 32 protein [Lachnospiraceae bacterium]
MTKLEKANKYQEENRIGKSYKPVFHITPVTGWMNDPNGFSLYKGKIHLFYQYHPYNTEWGPMHWGHYVSDDFIKWEEMPAALAPDESFDYAGCFSGSAIETEEGHMLVYTGVIEKENSNGIKEVIQHQCLAKGDGVHYEKIKDNPVIPADYLPEEFSRQDFRDPKVWKEDNVYYLVAGSRNGNQDGQVVLFKSDDLRKWEYLSVLAGNRGKYGKMWECPDFFEMDGKHVLIVSPMDMQADGQEFHNGNQSVVMTGEYNRQEHKFIEEQVVSLDYGTDFYAPQTMQARDGRRIMVAWMRSWDMDIKPQEQRWNGMMTVPRQLEIKDGVLYQSPVKELKNYYKDQVTYREKEISGKCTLPGINGRVASMEVELTGGDYKTFTIYFAKNERYYTCFRYIHAEQAIEYDRTYSGIVRDVVCKRTMKIKKPGDKLKLHLIFDKFSVELFVNNGIQVFTSVFYTPMEASGIEFECDGTAIVDIEKYSIDLD